MGSEEQLAVTNTVKHLTIQQTLQSLLLLPSFTFSSLQGSSLPLWMADTWFQDCWQQGRVTECRPSCPCPTAASRGCRAPLGNTGALTVATVAAAARCPSAWSCPWGKETAWAWWGPKASWPPPRPGRSSPPTAPSSCMHHRPKDSWSSTGQPQQGLVCSQKVGLEEINKL